MSKRVKKDVGLRARAVTTATEPAEIYDDLVAWSKQLDGMTPRQAARRDRAERYLAVLEKAGLADMARAALDVGRLRAAGYDEASGPWIAAEWLRELAIYEAARQSGNIELAVDTAEAMGRLEERLWWRASLEPATGMPPEALAIRGKAMTARNVGVNAKTAERIQFVSGVIARTGDRRRQQLSNAVFASPDCSKHFKTYEEVYRFLGSHKV